MDLTVSWFYLVSGSLASIVIGALWVFSGSVRQAVDGIVGVLASNLAPDRFIGYLVDEGYAAVVHPILAVLTWLLR